MIGIDVSYHNKQIDWGLVKADGVEFAIIRDCQNNKTYNSIYIKLKRSKSISYMRTDNLQPTNNILKVVRNK